jgi:PilZ domain
MDRVGDRAAAGVDKSEEQAAMGALAWSIAEPAPMERRRHQRVKVRLVGWFMRSDRLEFDCESIDVSPGGIAFSSDAGVQPGVRIVAYLNQIGRIEGRVARTFPTGFAVQMTLPPAKREKLADQMTWLANRQSLGLPEDRRHAHRAARPIRDPQARQRTRVHRQPD